MVVVEEEARVAALKKCVASLREAERVAGGAGKCGAGVVVELCRLVEQVASSDFEERGEEERGEEGQRRGGGVSRSGGGLKSTSAVVSKSLLVLVC